MILAGGGTLVYERYWLHNSPWLWNRELAFHIAFAIVLTVPVFLSYVAIVKVTGKAIAAHV